MEDDRSATLLVRDRALTSHKGAGERAVALRARSGGPRAGARPATVDRSGLIDALVATSAAAVLAGVIPLLLWRATQHAQVGAWRWALAMSFITGCRMAWLIGAAQRRLYEFSVWLFFYVFFGLAPLVQLRKGISPSTTPGMTWGNAGVTFGILGAAAASFYCGALARRSAGSSESTESSLARRPVVLAARNVYWLAGVALLLNAYFLSRIGLSSVFGSRDDLEQAAARVWPDPTTRIVVRAVTSMLLLVAFVALLQLRRHAALAARTDGARPMSLFWPVITGVVLVVTVNPASSPRYIAGTVLLSISAALGAYATRRRFRVVAVASVAGLLLIFPLADSFRHSTDNGLKKSGTVAALSSGDFDSFAQVANTQTYVAEQGSTHGRQALGAALFWVPRTAWSNKPIDTGTLLAQSRGYSFGNLSAPLPAELYINGSWILLVLGMALFGWWVRGADDRIVHELRLAPAPGTLSCILPFYLIIVLRGSLLQAMAYLVVIVVASRWLRGRGPDVGAGEAAAG